MRVPILSAFHPNRWMFCVGFSIAVMASVGVDVLLRGQRPSRRAIFVGFGCALETISKHQSMLTTIPKQCAGELNDSQVVA
jgi:hypothetical protein